MADVTEWPFNPNFPQTFSFPAFGTAEWLALALWRDCRGDATVKLKSEVDRDWQTRWFWIYQRNYSAAQCRFLNGIHFADTQAARRMGVDGWTGTPTKATVFSLPDTERYSLTKPDKWVGTLLNADDFWLYDINAWAIGCVEAEFRTVNPNGGHFAAYGIGADAAGAKAKQCEYFCRRFHAYQQARYRWHEHLLEKHCDRVLGKRDKTPQTALEARACLIGWLSQQKGYARHPLVNQFTRRKPSKDQKQERFFFSKERCAPSNRPYRTPRSAPSRPDEMGWLILTWPIWDFYEWQWWQVGSALIKKFRFVDAKGKPLDFLQTSRKRLQKTLRNKDSMPIEDFFTLFERHLCNPTPKEKEMHEDWGRTIKSRRGDKAIKQLCRRAAGCLHISPRAKVRGTDEKPPLWDFALQISA